MLSLKNFPKIVLCVPYPNRFTVGRLQHHWHLVLPQKKPVTAPDGSWQLAELWVNYSAFPGLCDSIVFDTQYRIVAIKEIIYSELISLLPPTLGGQQTHMGKIQQAAFAYHAERYP